MDRTVKSGLNKVSGQLTTSINSINNASAELNLTLDIDVEMSIEGLSDAPNELDQIAEQLRVIARKIYYLTVRGE